MEAAQLAEVEAEASSGAHHKLRCSRRQTALPPTAQPHGSSHWIQRHLGQPLVANEAPTLRDAGSRELLRPGGKEEIVRTKVCLLRVVKWSLNPPCKRYNASDLSRGRWWTVGKRSVLFL